MLESPVGPDFDAFIVIPASDGPSYAARPQEAQAYWRTGNWNANTLPWPPKPEKK